MNHSFNIDIAKKYGVFPAVMLENIYFWTKKNQANQTHFYDGYYWTYNSAKAFSELFPYASEKTIRNALNKLIDNGLLIKGNYNKIKTDRTLWYAMTDKGLELFEEVSEKNEGISNCPKGKMEVPKRENGSSQKGRPLPYINPNISPDIKPVNNTCSEFDILWNEYPRKQGKQQALKAYEKAVKSGTTFEEVQRGIYAYLAYIKKEKIKPKYIKMGSTFFNQACWADDYGDQPTADNTDLDGVF